MLASLLKNRRLQRFLLGVLRRWMPLTRLGKYVVVTPHQMVTEVLERPDDFSVVAVYFEKMRRTSGAFYLGMDDTPRYARERALTNRALAAMSAEWYRDLSRQFATEALVVPAGRGELDVVQELSWVVPLRLCEEFFGVRGPDRRTLARWIRYIFQHLFLNLGDDTEVAARAERLAVEMRDHLDGLIAERLAEPASQLAERKDFLSQLVLLQSGDGGLSADDVCRNVGGVILGSVDTVSRCVVNALEELLTRPKELAAVQKAAREGNRDFVDQCVFEALRFNPHNPLVVRRALRDTTLHTERGEELLVPAGSQVFAMTYSAMFDPEKFRDPDKFRTDRPGLSHLQFGFGMHRCFGERVALLAVPEILTPLLCRENLARIPGKAGQIVSDGPFPDHFRVTFDATVSPQAVA